MSTHSLPPADSAFWAVPVSGFGFQHAVEVDEADGLSIGYRACIPYVALGGMDYVTVERIAVNVESPDGQPVTLVAVRHRDNRLSFGVAKGTDIDLLAAPAALEPQAAAA